MDPSRRSFFGILLAGAPAAALTVPHATEPIEGPLRFGDVLCPQCLYTQPYPIRSQFETTEAYVAHVTSPQRIQCYNSECAWEGVVTFARRG